MFNPSLRGAITVSILLIGQTSFASLKLSEIKNCISNEMDVVRVVHPLKAEYLRAEREGSVTELINMLKENTEDLDLLSEAEASSARGKALTKEIGEIEDVLENSKSCVDARKSMLKFANIYEKKPLLSLSVFFEKDNHGDTELSQWNAEAKESLKNAGYSKALANFEASRHPALALLLASGETTSVLDEQFMLERDDTMRAALKAIVGDDASADILEERLAEKMRKESLNRMSAISAAANEFVRK
ncbi:hypothetical protein [Bdellovibrio sp. KM01]|uniref:hypothetical protein n=1 Tax=Bdellovibrio sp. KM01 TaxID=2748865 RepID=UPI0015EA049D|nr:hypothetical protein [Bdellovibrio sp. KM01]QLY25560.1 hypothetical protein HW988_00415 [Bdellovibrio sp. KM01]